MYYRLVNDAAPMSKKSLTIPLVLWVGVLFAGLVSGIDNVDQPIKSFNTQLKELKSSNNLTRILQGVTSNYGEFPYQVIIFYDYKSLCGGTLLPSKRHVLTAARCLYGLNVVKFIVNLDTVNLFNSDPNTYWKGNVANFFHHEKYNPATFENDIGIIYLTNPIDVEPVRLEPKFNLRLTYANQPATVVGWGSTLRTLNPDPYPVIGPDLAAVSSVLQKGTVTIISSKDCGIHYHSFSVSKSVLLYTKPNQFLCATSFTGQDSCESDTGGPLIVNGFQVGIISNGVGCNDPRYPRVYTRVGFYIDWIKDAVTLA